MKLNENLIEKLRSISWFCNCGTPWPFDWAVSVASMKEALKAISSSKWENIILGAQGDVTEQLSIRSIKGLGREYQEWNRLVEDLKKRYMPQFQKQWRTALEPSGLDRADVLNDISFNVLSIVMTDAYKELVPVPPLFLRLLEVYEAGHLPCGWKGAVKTGKIIVY